MFNPKTIEVYNLIDKQYRDPDTLPEFMEYIREKDHVEKIEKEV